MKLGIFTDSHYSSAEVTCRNRYNNKSLLKIKDAYRFFESKNCDLAVFQGHYHSGNESLHNGIRYVTLPAMSERDAAYFTEEI